ncbi:MAG: DUF2812 domain-containing protein [Oscillospiraceae bacterium]|nr:DUF2812 domain-containing protein [Oscillospiraceae bacterium]
MTERTDINKIWKIFTLAQYEKEAGFLTHMAEQGWGFVKTDGFCYTFERCTPAQYTYRLDCCGIPFHQRGKYYEKLRSHGWEHVKDCNGIGYFRKSSADISTEDSGLFGGSLSLHTMTEKAHGAMAVSFLISCFVLLLFAFRNSGNLLVNGETLAANPIYMIFLAAILLFCIMFFCKSAADCVILKKNMVKGEVKQVRRRFTIADYEKEEAYLTDMAAQGWRLVTFTLNRYTFEHCEPEKIVYRLDYSGRNQKKREDYYTMFRDYGWEFVTNLGGFSYFRKSAEGVSPEDLEIFSDGESHLEMVKKLIRCEVLPSLVIMILIVLQSIGNIREQLLEGQLSIVMWIMTVILLVLIVFCVIRWVRISADFVRLKRKYKKSA